MEPRTHAIVVGGGPAGLLAAIHLSRAGIGVSVLEARAQLGGRASSDPFGAADPCAGLELNQGPHALYLGGAARRELAAVGIDPPGWRPKVAFGSVWLRDGAAHRAPAGPRALAGFARWAAGLRGPRPDLAGASTADWLGAELPDPDARRIAAMLTRVATYAADQGALSADAAAAQVALALRPGVRYLGGWQPLVERLAATARAAGATVETGVAVRALAPDGAGWSAQTDEGARGTDVVVLASGGPDRAARLLGREIPAPGPPAEVAALDLLLKRLPRPRRTFAGGLETPHYLSVHSRPGRAPVHLSLAAYLTPEEGTAGTREALETVADRVQPGWRDELVAEPRHLARMRASTAIPTTAAGGLAGRPAPTAPEAPGLALAGDWVGPEGLLLDAALASARAAVGAVLGERRAMAAA